MIPRLPQFALVFSLPWFMSSCVQAAQGSNVPAPPFPAFLIEDKASGRVFGKASGYTVEFTKRGPVYRLPNGPLRVEFFGGSQRPPRAARPIASEQVNFIGKRGFLVSSVTSIRSVGYSQVYKGIDVQYTAVGSTIKSELVIRPGVSLQSISLRFSGARMVAIEDSGKRVCAYRDDVSICEGPITAYEELGDERRQNVDVSFSHQAKDTVTLIAPKRNSQYTLVVDPAIQYSSVLAGSGTEMITATAVDTMGFVYVAGYTDSVDLPVIRVLPGTAPRRVDTFVAKFDPAQSKWIYCTYLGGAWDDRASAIAVDQSGAMIVAGTTTSPDFPVVNGSQTLLRGSRDAFIAKIAPSGDRLLFSTYLGGDMEDDAAGIGVDMVGNVHVVGSTNSSNFPVLYGFQPYQGRRDGFLTVFNTAGRMLCSTFIGGFGDDSVSAVAVDPWGTRYIAGTTNSPNLPQLNAYQNRIGGREDAFIMKFSPSSILEYATYVGGTGTETATGIAVDLAGNAHVAGTTSSVDFPLVKALQSSLIGTSDCFIASFNSAGGAVFLSYFGASGPDTSTAVAVSKNRTVYLTGYTAAADFPQVGGGASAKGDYDAFLVQYAPDYRRIQFATLIGGSATDSSHAIAIADSEMAWVGGRSASVDFPGNYTPRGGSEGFLIGLNMRQSARLGFFSAGQWYRDTNANFRVDATDAYTLFGNPSAVPVIGDWDGSGSYKIGVFDHSWWYLDHSGDGYWSGEAIDRAFLFGNPTVRPVIGDWAGIGRSCIGVFDRGAWYLDWNCDGGWSGTTIDRAYVFANPTAMPLAGDWDGSRRSKIGVYDNGWWYLDFNGNGLWDGAAIDGAYRYAAPGTVPVVGDWLGSGKTQIGLFDPVTATWYLDLNGNGIWDGPNGGDSVITYGYPGVTPIAGSW
jgi:hypothetical protein